jgi:hypothetical protein
VLRNSQDPRRNGFHLEHKGFRLDIRKLFEQERATSQTTDAEGLQVAKLTLWVAGSQYSLDSWVNKGVWGP